MGVDNECQCSSNPIYGSHPGEINPHWLLMLFGGSHNFAISGPTQIYPETWHTIGPFLPNDADINEGSGDNCLTSAYGGALPECETPTPYYLHWSSSMNAKNTWTITGAMNAWLPDEPA